MGGWDSFFSHLKEQRPTSPETGSAHQFKVLVGETWMVVTAALSPVSDDVSVMSSVLCITPPPGLFAQILQPVMFR